jgi:hypothetical protein
MRTNPNVVMNPPFSLTISCFPMFNEQSMAQASCRLWRHARKTPVRWDLKSRGNKEIKNLIIKEINKQRDF